MNFANFSKLSFAVSFVVALFGGVGSSLASDPYMAQDKYMRVAKQMHRKGKYPTALRCKVDLTKRYLQPEVEADWQDNTRNIEWHLNVYKGLMEFTPTDIENWKRVSRTVIPLRGTKLFCLLYHKR